MLKEQWHKVFKREQDGHGSMLSKSIFVFGIKTVSSAMGFLILLLLARVLGKEELGHYTYAFTWTSVISLIAVCGFDRLMVREFSRWRAQGLDGLLAAFFKSTQNWILIAALLLTGIAYAASYLPLEFFADDKTRSTYRFALMMIPIAALIAHRRSALNGIREVVIAHFPEKLVQPGLLILVLLLLWLLPGVKLNAETAIVVNVCSWGAALVVAHWLFKQKGPELVPTETDNAERKRWWRLAFSILIFNLSMVMFARIDVLMLRPMQDAESVGVYSIAFKLASYLNFILVAFNGVIAPSISQYHHQGKKEELQQMITKMVRSTAVIALPIAAILIFGNEWIMSIFGDGFTEGGFALIVMVGGQLVNLLVGPVGNLLIMTNQERIAALCFLISTILNGALNYWLIPIYSYEGAAIATSISLAFNNLLMMAFVMIRLKINPTIFFFK